MQTNKCKQTNAKKYKQKIIKPSKSKEKQTNTNKQTDNNKIRLGVG